jgi:NAD(P)H-dependent FMN reductase
MSAVGPSVSAGPAGAGSVGPAGTIPAAGTAASAGRVAVVVGSTRTNRICGAVTAWTVEHLSASNSLRYEIVDLATVGLPMLDEPFPAASGRYEHEHTRSWSRLVDSFDAFVFVFPQYNWGYPAPLKNALDFLYHEWAAKPAALVTYGTRGGGRAAAQLRQVLQGLHMRPLDQGVELRLGPDDMDGEGQPLDLATSLAPFADAVRAVDDQLVVSLAAGGDATP